MKKVMKGLKYVFFIYVFIGALIWSLSSPVSRYFVKEQLIKHQLVLSDNASFWYNPFTSHLYIKNVALSPEQTLSKKVFSLDALHVEVSLFQLLFDTIYVSTFSIDGLFINVTQINQSLEIAGLKLDELAQEQTTIDNTAPEKEDKPTAALPYQLSLPELLLTDTNIELNIEGSIQHIALQSFILNNVEASMAGQKLVADLKSEINGAPLLFNIDLVADLINKQAEAKFNIALTSLNLAKFQYFLPENIQALAGGVSFNTDSEFTLSNNIFNVEFNDLALITDDLTVNVDDYFITLAQESFTSDKTTMIYQQGNNAEKDHLEAKLDAQITLNDFKVTTVEKTQVVAAFEQVNIPNISLSLVDDTYQLNVLSFAMSKILFSDDIENDVLPMVKSELLEVKNIDLSEQGIVIDSIDLTDFDVTAEIDENKQLLNLVTLPSNKQDTESKADEEQTTPDKKADIATQENAGFALQLNHLKLVKPGNISFIDNSVKPAYSHNVVVSTFNGSSFNSELPANESLMNLAGTIDQYTTFDFKAKLKPFMEQPQFNIDGTLNEFSLPAVSSYIKDALKYEIESGQLDLTVDVDIKDNEVSGDLGVLLRGIELTGADDHEVGKLKDVASMPLNAALGILKDVNGNVDLSLPLSGDLDDPSFGVSGLITLLVKQATISAAKEYVITTFLPYANVVKVAMAAGQLVFNLDIQPLYFEPQQVELSSAQTVFLDEFAALMNKEDELQAKLCAVATPLDIGLPLEQKITSDEVIAQLHTLSKKRVDVFKQYMVAEKGIKSARLLLCTSQIDIDKTAQARLTFNTQ